MTRLVGEPRWCWACGGEITISWEKRKGGEHVRVVEEHHVPSGTPGKSWGRCVASGTAPVPVTGEDARDGRRPD